MGSIHRKRRQRLHDDAAVQVAAVREAFGVADVHDIEIDMPSKVYVLASGPNGESAYSQVKEGAFIVAVNRGAAIWRDRDLANLKPSVWVVADHRATEKRYFRGVYLDFDGVKVFSEQTFQRCANLERGLGRVVTFSLVDRDLLVEEFIPFKRRFRPDGSVSGAALWLAHLCGVKHAVLVGVDMSGDADYMGNLPKDWRHGEEWKNRRALDAQIRWHKKHGMVVETLSKTMLIEPKAIFSVTKDVAQKRLVQDVPVAEKRHELPTVGYVVMAYQRQHTMHAIINAVDQDYPDELKTVYLMHQEPFPKKYAHDLSVKIVEINVDGQWPALWAWKLRSYLEACTSIVGIVWDEDDRFERSYTRKVVEALYRANVNITWNDVMETCKHDAFKRAKYKPPYGAMAFKVDALKGLFDEFMTKYPQGFEVADRGDTVPLDGYFCNFIKSKLGKVMTHDARRYYVFHSKANSFLNHHRRRGVDNVDRVQA